MRQVSLDDTMPLLHIHQTLNRQNTLTIVHHNTEGLPSHVKDIKSHHELCLADVLCLTEMVKWENTFYCIYVVNIQEIQNTVHSGF